jgi:hypothetical protein
MKIKVITKREVMKLKPGAVIELWWNDTKGGIEFTRAILLEKPELKAGDVSLHCLHDNLTSDKHAIHSQVFSVLRENIFNY